MEIPQFYFTVAAISILGTFLVTAAVMISEIKNRFDGLLESLCETSKEEALGKGFPPYEREFAEEYFERLVARPVVQALHLTMMFSGRETGKDRAVRLLDTGFDHKAANLVLRMMNSAKTQDDIRHLWDMAEGSGQPDEVREVLKKVLGPRAFMEIGERMTAD